MFNVRRVAATAPISTAQLAAAIFALVACYGDAKPNRDSAKTAASSQALVAGCDGQAGMPLTFSDILEDTSTGDQSGLQFTLSLSQSASAGTFREAAGELGGARPLANIRAGPGGTLSFVAIEGKDSAYFDVYISCDSIWGRWRPYPTVVEEHAVFRRATMPATPSDQPPAQSRDAPATDSLRFAGTPVVVDDTTLGFPSGATFISGLYGIQYLGQLPAHSKAPFLLLAGSQCTECDLGLSVLLRSPSDGRLKPDSTRYFDYPGRITDNGTDHVGFASRLFFGRCLSEHGHSVVQFATAYDSTGATERGVRVAEVVGDSLVERDLKVPLPVLGPTLARVKSGLCREVPARDAEGPP